MKKNRKYIIAAVIVLVIGLVAFRAFQGKAAESAAAVPRQNIPLVKVEKPLREDVAFVLKYTGDIAAIQQANIFSKVSGNIEKIYVDLGSAVRRNQVLAIIDSTELYQAYQQTSATFINARVSYQRTKQLFEQNLVARQDLDNAEAAMKVAEANFATARTRLSYAKITSPFSGFVTKRFLDRGALVQPGSSTLFTVMKNDSLKVIVNILEKDIPFITRNKKAIIKVDAYPDKEFEGVITNTNQAIDVTTRTMAAEIDIPNRGNLLKPGMFADVSIFVENHPDAITVPAQALLHDAKGDFVMLYDNGKARRANVKQGIEQNGRTEIISGLSGQEDIISTGQNFARDGLQVRLANR
ncbi:MAG: efflux RND transporter periplasmic adaptor subunit [Bacillota bacterium]